MGSRRRRRLPTAMHLGPGPMQLHGLARPHAGRCPAPLRPLLECSSAARVRLDTVCASRSCGSESGVQGAVGTRAALVRASRHIAGYFHCTHLVIRHRPAPLTLAKPQTDSQCRGQFCAAPAAWASPPAMATAEVLPKKLSFEDLSATLTESLLRLRAQNGSGAVRDQDVPQTDFAAELQALARCVRMGGWKITHGYWTSPDACASLGRGPGPHQGALYAAC